MRKKLISHGPFVTSERFWEVSKLNLTVEHRLNLKPSSVLSHALSPIHCASCRVWLLSTGWGHMLYGKGQGTQGAEITLLPTSPHSFCSNSLRWKPLSACRMSCTEGAVGSSQATKVGGKERTPQGMLVLLFRKKKQTLGQEREISQQQQYAKNILLQNEGIIGICHEARPHGEKVKVSCSVVSDCDLMDWL